MAAPILPHDDRGSGNPILLVHGFPLHRGIWKGQLDPLAALGRVIAFDLPGFGQASTLRAPESIEGLTALVDSSAHAIASPAAVLLGHSLGGYVALQQYADHPERVRALILVDTRSEADTEEAYQQRHDTIAQLRQNGPGTFAVQTARNLLSASHAQDPDLFSTVLQITRSAPVPALVSTLLALSNRPDYTEFLSEVRVPTLVLWGEDDRTIPPEQTQKLVERIEGAKGVGIPNAGHLPFLENPTAFNQAVTEFLSSLPAPGETAGAPAEEPPA